MVSLAVLLAAGLLFPIQAKPASAEFSPDEILVKFKDGALPEERTRVHRTKQGRAQERIDRFQVEVVKIEPGKVREKIAEYEKDSLVEYAEPNFVASALELTSDPGVVNNLQWGLFKVKAADAGVSAWTSAKSQPSVAIAILDTGVDQDHEDLAAKIVNQRNCTTSPTLDDLFGHGTHVAGVAAAATNNSLGIAGMGYNASLVNAKVLDDDGYGYYSWIVSCLTWAADSGAKVVNMSFGGSGKSRTLENAVNYAWSKGVVMTGAAGNSGTSSPLYPANYQKVIAVAATDQNDKKPGWSTFGKWVDVAAPGVQVYSTLPNHVNAIGPVNYGSLSGTSLATPHVAGLAALVWPTPLGGSNSNVRKQIEGTADKISGTGTLWGFGRVNALRAVTEAGRYSAKTNGR